MRILYLKIIHFKRMPLREIEIFEHNFSQKLFMIKGPNGSGKSSLCNELTPLPSDKNNFNKDGYKEIHIEKDKKVYKLISDFREGSKYHFLLDDEELNLSNNVTTQRELVYSHFNVNDSIHDILIGKETFTNMSLLARKKLFNTITHINIDDILQNYNKLKEELKANELLLKSQTSLYKTEENKLADTCHVETLQDRLTKTKEHIEFLLTLRTNIHKYIIDSNIETSYTDTKELFAKIKETIDKYYIYIVTFPNKSLNKYKIEYSNQLSVVSYQLETLYNQLEKKQEEYKLLELTKETNLNNIIEKKTTILDHISKLTSSLKYIVNVDQDLTEIKSAVYKLEVSIPEIVRSIPTNDLESNSRVYTKDKYDHLLETKKKLIDELTELSSSEISMNKELNELNNSNDLVNCPSCNHTWSLKNIPATISELKLNISNILKKKQINQEELIKISKQIDMFIEYFTLYKQYSNLRNSTMSILPSLWNDIDKQELIFNDPSSILSYIKILSIELSTIDNIQLLKKELLDIEKNITIISNLKDTSTETLLSEIEELEFSIQDLQQYKESLNKHLLSIEKATKIYSYLDTLQNALEASVSRLNDINVSISISNVINVIDSDLSKHKVTLIEIEKELYNYETIKYTLDKYKKTIDDTSTRIKILKILLDELSPKNGLIAKSVSSFLNIIIENVNRTINTIWTYKMVLKPIDVENDVLNYRFKVEVDNKLSIQDISLCSAGMQEMINLSFKLILYKLLNLDGYPLFLDELGSALDTHHSNNVLNLVQQLSNSGKFSQIYIITHKENYDYLKDVCTIDLEN